MSLTELCWVAMLNLIPPTTSLSYQKKISRSIPARMQVCLQVANEAKRQNVDPFLAVSIAYHESRFENITSHAGARGPLGVLPKYHCPKKEKCDYTRAGISALKKFLKLNKGKLCRSLAQYNRGLDGKCKHGRSEYQYAQKVLELRMDLLYFNQQSHFDQPIR